MTKLPNSATTWHDQRRLISELRIPGIPKALLHAVHGFLGKNVKAWPSYERLATLISRARRTVIRWMGWLIEQGFLERVKRWDPKTESYRSNLYRIRWEILAGRIEPPCEIVEISDPPNPSLEGIPKGGVVIESHYPSVRESPDRLIGSDILSLEREDFDFSENPDLGTWDPDESEADELRQIPGVETGSKQPAIETSLQEPEGFAQRSQQEPRLDLSGGGSFKPKQLEHKLNPDEDPLIVPVVVASYEAMGCKVDPETAGRLSEYPAAVHRRQVEKCRQWLADGKPIRNWKVFLFGDKGLPTSAREVAAAESEAAAAAAAATARIEATRRQCAEVLAVEKPSPEKAAPFLSQIRTAMGLSRQVPPHPGKPRIAAEGIP